MELKKLVEAVTKYLNGFKIECESDFVEGSDQEATQILAEVILPHLDNELFQLRILCYTSGTAQITFNMGPVKEDPRLYSYMQEFNVKSFGFKAVIEYDELRFYNQAFFKDLDNFMYNLDVAVGFFLQNNNLDTIKPMQEFVLKKAN